MVRFGALTAALLAACSFRPNASNGDAPAMPHDATPIDLPVDVVIDSPPPNACMSASAACLDANTLETCTGPGAQPVVTTCTWGCLTAGTDHCGNFTPSGGAVTGGDLDGNGVGDVTLNNTVVNTDNGTIIGVTTGFTHALRNGVQVFKFRSLMVNGNISFIGSNPAAFAASGTITVGGTLDLRGPCAVSRSIPGSGGFAGGDGDAAGAGPGAGAAQTGKNNGGGGAGYGATGGAGDGGTTGGTAYGDNLISMLVGGSGGGGGHNAGHVGGGGGGAIQLASNTSIVINSGGINAGGCGGHSTAGDGNGGGGGGGAGGSILLEAPTVRVSGTLAVNGGAGGGLMTDGGDATLDRTAATNADGGGAGGAGATMTGTDAPSKGGGGGGAVGRIRITTRSGQATVTGTMSPALNDPGTTATEGTSNVN
jgi:hypothetical protein